MTFCDSSDFDFNHFYLGCSLYCLPSHRASFPVSLPSGFFVLWSNSSEDFHSKQWSLSAACGWIDTGREPSEASLLRCCASSKRKSLGMKNTYRKKKNSASFVRSFFFFILQRIQLVIKAHCVPCSHIENHCAAAEALWVGSGMWQQSYEREPPAFWLLVFKKGLCLCVVSTELNRESIIFFSISVRFCPPPPRPGSASHCMGAPCHAAQMKAKHSADGLIRLQQRARSSRRLPSLPLFRERGVLTLSAAAGTFENNCLYDCYFSHLFEEV